MACMKAYTVVGPTNFQPCFFRSFDSAIDCGGGRRGLRFCELLGVRFVAPDEGRQRAFPLDELLSPSRIVDDRLDLAAMADDALHP